MPFEQELTTAIEAAQKAASLIRRDYESFVPIPNAPASISTDTDRSAQEIILQHLLSVFPDDAYCAEEVTPSIQSARTTGPRVWIVDPIDGTRGFAMKNGEFSVMIGLVQNGELTVGVVLEPVLDRLTYASRGSGCWVRIGEQSAQRCIVSTTANLHESVLVQSHSKSHREPSAPVKALQPAKVLEVYSAGVKLALVARGEADLYVNTYANFHDWNICAGHLLVAEAGGTVSTLQGEDIHYCSPGYWQRGGLLATNRCLHDAAVRNLVARVNHNWVAQSNIGQGGLLMCCFSRKVDLVADTNIFARASTDGRQYLVYSMRFKAGEDLAMILPIPVPKESKEDAVKFLNLDKYADFFDDMRSGFEQPVPKSEGRGKDKRDAPKKLAVVEVGSYIASFVPAVKDFARFDERFRLPADVWDKLPQYKDWGFAVFQLKKGDMKVHPMAFEFPRANKKQLFFPTVHIHDRTVPMQASFDHLLYCQTSGDEAIMTWGESPQPAGLFMKKLDAAHGIVDPKSHCYRKVMKGRFDNRDVVV